MSDVRDEIEALRRRLEGLEKEALVEMCLQLSRTYLVEGLGTLAAATDQATPARDEVGEETFAGMLRRLKRERVGDPVLDKFIVNGEHIQVKTPMGNVDVTEYRRAAPPARPAPSAPAPAVPTPRDSVYNRELYEKPAAGQPSSAPARPAARPAAPAAPAGAAKPAEPAKDQSQQRERFRMIELD